jgi:hypothetical protein
MHSGLQPAGPYRVAVVSLARQSKCLSGLTTWSAVPPQGSHVAAIAADIVAADYFQSKRSKRKARWGQNAQLLRLELSWR